MSRLLISCKLCRNRETYRCFEFPPSVDQWSAGGLDLAGYFRSTFTEQDGS